MAACVSRKNSAYADTGLWRGGEKEEHQESISFSFITSSQEEEEEEEFLLLRLIRIPFLLLLLHLGLLIGRGSSGSTGTTLHVATATTATATSHQTVIGIATGSGGRTVRVSAQVGRLSLQWVDLEGRMVKQRNLQLLLLLLD